MKKTKKNKSLWLKETDIAVGDLYFTTAGQYRAVLALKGDFLIYAPSSEGLTALATDEPLPFANSPWKKCQISTFARKDYQAFDFNGQHAGKHTLSTTQLQTAIAQCNAATAITELLAAA